MVDLFDRISITIVLISALLSCIFALINEIWALVFLGVLVVTFLLLILKKIWEE